MDKEKLTLMGRVQYLSDRGRIICTFNNLVVPHLLYIRNQFTKYPLRDAVNFSSSYTWRFYEILVSWAEDKRNTNGLIIGWIDRQNVDELREMLGVPDSYKWSDFQRQVLNVVVSELKEKANIHVVIETKKTSRKITHLDIEFIEDNQKKLPLK